MLLALLAGASAIGRTIYGRVRLWAVLEHQLLVLALIPPVIIGIMGLVGGTTTALVECALIGVFLAPQLIVGYLIADTRTDPRTRTEASSWISTAVNFGAALGAVLFGTVTDALGPGPALVVGALIAVALIRICSPFLLRPRRGQDRQC